MSKIGKKYNLYSSNTFNQFIDLLLSGRWAPGTYGSFFSFFFDESYNLNNKNYEGKIWVKYSGTGAAYTDKFNTLFPEYPIVKNTISNQRNTYINFDVVSHYEELVEMKTLVSSSIRNERYKFKSPLEYNFYIENFESYLATPEGIAVNERSMPSLYDIIDIAKTQNIEFEKIYENINFWITDPTEGISTILQTKIVNDKQIIGLDKYLKQQNIFKEQTPFYADEI